MVERVVLFFFCLAIGPIHACAAVGTNDNSLVTKFTNIVWLADTMLILVLRPTGSRHVENTNTVLPTIQATWC